MQYQIFICAILILFIFNLLLNLRRIKIPDRNAKLAESIPFISVLVPARNEEANIKSCLESLLKQDYPNYEILVLDDNSSDKTAEIVREISGVEKRVRLIAGNPLPDGWAGKCYACYQLARQAKGSWLLFTDADTVHEPHMLRSILNIAVKEKVSLISGFPRLTGENWAEKIVLPVIYFIILGWIPLWFIQNKKFNIPSLAIGQFLFFNTRDYWKFGGHEAVKAKILEDVWLCVQTVRHGGKYLAVDLSSTVTTKMYRSVGDMWEGFVKWMYSVVSLSPWLLFVLLVVAYIFYLAPFYELWKVLFILPEPGDVVFIVTFQVIIIFLMRWLVDSHFKEPAVSTVAHPASFVYVYLAALYAAFRYLSGSGVSWKKRVYYRESGVK